MLWLILAVLTLLTVASLLVPLWRARTPTDIRIEHDLAVYRDQLAELDNDLARGVLTPIDAEAARLEIQRRILRADAETEAPPATASRLRALAATAVILLVPVLAGGLYWHLGRPDLPERLAGRAEPAAESADRAPEIAGLADKLRARLEAEPGDVRGWMLLARSYIVLQRYDEAAAAFTRASTLQPNDPDPLMGRGEAEIFAADGMVTQRAEATFRAVLALDPKHPGARYYLALGRSQAGQLREALDDWLALAADSPADAPWQEALQAQIRDTARALNIDLATVSPKAPPAADSAPPEVDVRAMVDRLAARLEQSPDDFDGWMRLGRARTVLQEYGASSDAYTNALRLKPDDPDALWFAGQAAAAAGRPEAARQHWQKLQGLLPSGSPERAELDRRLGELGRSR